MKSRRRIAFPKAQDHANRAMQLREQSRKLGLTKWGPTIILRRESFVAAMSLKGSGADIAGQFSDVRFNPVSDTKSDGRDVGFVAADDIIRLFYVIACYSALLVHSRMRRAPQSSTRYR